MEQFNLEISSEQMLNMGKIGISIDRTNTIQQVNKTCQTLEGPHRLLL